MATPFTASWRLNSTAMKAQRSASRWTSVTKPGLALRFHADEYGEPEHVARFVLRCAETFDLEGAWGFCWSLTCSKPRIEGFGGGGFVLDLKKRETVASIDCADWLAHHMAGPVELAEHRQQEATRENGPLSQ